MFTPIGFFAPQGGGGSVVTDSLEQWIDPLVSSTADQSGMVEMLHLKVVLLLQLVTISLMQVVNTSIVGGLKHFHHYGLGVLGLR